MNYCHFNAEDFAADDYFKQWVCSPNQQSDAFWKNFQRTYPEKYYTLEEGRLLVESLYQINKNNIDADQVDALWTRIEESVTKENQLPFLSRMAINKIWLVAAMALIISGFAYLWHTKSSTPLSIITSATKEVNLVEVINHTDDTLRVNLPDGSFVILQEKSGIKYSKQFNTQNRTLYLEGNAFFNVEKDPSKPFLVYANGLVTKVLGTSFTIQAQDKAPNVSVSVKSGRVSVYSDSSTPDPEAGGIILTPNQKAVFQKETSILTKTLVEIPEVLIESKSLPSFIFEDIPASEIFSVLEKVYGIDVVYDEEVMKNCTLTINLNEENLFQKLNVICKVLDAQFKLIEAQVIIYSKGC
jgi:transmembrane sensor